MDNVVLVLYQISYAFQQCKNLENRLRFDKVNRELKGENFFRDTVYSFDRE